MFRDPNSETAPRARQLAGPLQTGGDPEIFFWANFLSPREGPPHADAITHLLSFASQTEVAFPFYS